MRTFGSKFGHVGFNYEKKVRIYKTLDEQRAAAVESILQNKQVDAQAPDKTELTKEELFASVKGYNDLVFVLQLLHGGDEQRIRRLLHLLDDFNEQRGGPPARYCPKKVAPEPTEEAKERAAIKRGKDWLRKQPKPKMKQGIERTEEVYYERDDQGNLIRKVRRV